MRKVICFCAAFVIFTSCQQSSNSNPSTADSTRSTGSSDEMSKEARNKRIAIASVKARNEGNPDSILAGASRNVVDYGDGSMPAIKGKDSIRALINRDLGPMKTAFPDFKVDDVVGAASGDTVLVWARYSATWKHDMMGQKATGKSFRIYGVEYFVFNDAGEVVEHRSTPHDLEMAKQIGIRFP